MAHSQNRILASLPADLLAAIQPHLILLDLKHGDVLAEAESSVTGVYFPYSSVISLVVELKFGEMIETAMVGRDGVFNAASALGGKVSPNKAIVQLAGAASVIDVARIRNIADENKAFRSLLFQHEQILFAQSQQSAACNASHSVENRMCCWILRMRDVAGSEDLALTQEFLAQMLGVRRPSVSLVAETLQKAGFIKYQRGHIRILDAPGLEKESCECYGAIKAHFDRMIFGKKILKERASVSPLVPFDDTTER